MMEITINGITKSFHSVPVVDNVSFKIEKGRCVALIGPNGAGKTTLLNMLVGLIKQDKGTIDYQKENEWKKKIGFLPQVPHFYDWMTPNEFLFFMGNISGIDKSILKKRIQEVLSITGIETVAHKRIQGFSGGMKQRLGLAQALLHKPELLVLDEPVSALDPVGRRDVMNLLMELKQHSTIIYSTHVLHDAQEISDDILLMKDGKIVAMETLENLLSRTDQHYTLKTTLPLPIELSSCSFIKDLQMIGKTSADIVLHSPNHKDELLQWCIDHKLDIIHFQQGKLNLEDVFMEVMKS